MKGHLQENIGKVVLSQQEMTKHLVSKIRMLWLQLGGTRKELLTEFRVDVVGRAIQQGTVGLGVEI